MPFTLETDGRQTTVLTMHPPIIFGIVNVLPTVRGVPSVHIIALGAIHPKFSIKYPVTLGLGVKL